MNLQCEYTLLVYHPLWSWLAITGPALAFSSSHKSALVSAKSTGVNVCANKTCESVNKTCSLATSEKWKSLWGEQWKFNQIFALSAVKLPLVCGLLLVKHQAIIVCRNGQVY